jgi:hypothetical protein
MEDDLKECRSKRCPRRNVLVQTDARYCKMCGGRLKASSWRTKDQLPLTDPMGQEDNEMGPGKSTNTNGSGWIMNEDQFIRAGHGQYAQWQQYLRDNKIQTWQEYQGDYNAWKGYLASCGVGGIDGVKDYWPPTTYRGNSPNANYRGPVTKPSDEFTCDPDVKGCPIVEPIDVHVPWEMWQTFVQLTKSFNTEWIAYLKGKYDEKERGWIIESYYFPDQIVSGTHVEALDGQCQEGTIGAIHSHVDMSVFWSKEDEDHANHIVEIVINRKAEFKLAIRTQLGCGKWSRVESGKVYYIDLPAACDELKTKFKERPTQQTHSLAGAGFHSPHKGGGPALVHSSAPTTAPSMTPEQEFEAIRQAYLGGDYYD